MLVGLGMETFTCQIFVPGHSWHKYRLFPARRVFVLLWFYLIFSSYFNLQVEQLSIYLEMFD